MSIYVKSSTSTSRLSPDSSLISVKGGTSITVWLNNDIMIWWLNMTATNITHNQPVTNITLPSGIDPKQDINIITPLMNSAWVPSGLIAYLHFSPGETHPVVRITSGTTTVNSAVIIGWYTFPLSQFNIGEILIDERPEVT